MLGSIFNLLSLIMMLMKDNRIQHF